MLKAVACFEPSVRLIACPFFQYLATSTLPLYSTPATYTSLSETTMEVAPAGYDALPARFTAVPFFQYLAVYPVINPATYTSLPTAAIEFAEAQLTPLVRFTPTPFFQYLATGLLTALYSIPATYTSLPDNNYGMGPSTTCNPSVR